MNKIKYIILCLMTFLIMSCKTTQTIEQSHQAEIVTQIQYVERVDSIYVDRYHTEYMKGDTVYKVDSIFLSKLQYIKDTSVIHDTITNIKVEHQTSIIEKKVPQWWPVYLAIGIVLFGGIYIFINKPILFNYGKNNQIKG